MPQSLATPLKNGSTTTKESNMYYVTPYKNNSGGMVIWRHVKRLKDFKADEGIEYLVAKTKKEMDINMGSSLPIYIGLNGELKKCSTYALYLF
jgi:hypothetical protein